MYRTPMRLWSTVLKKPGMPGASSHRSSSSSATSGVGFSVTAIALLLQALEVRRQRGDVTVGQRLERGHRDVGLDRLRVANPVAHVLRRVLDRAGAEQAARSHVGEVRAERAS